MALKYASSVVAVVITAALGWACPARADDAPPPPLAPVVDRLFPEFKKKAEDLPPFLRDADVILHLRTFYFNRHKPDDTDNEALATGGWLSYRSGWLFDTFSMGATFYGSAPLYAPDDRDGTLLLQPDQKGYYVPGEAWGALRYKDYARFTGYRQKIDVGYVNSHDNRMTPNTFEAVTLERVRGHPVDPEHVRGRHARRQGGHPRVFHRLSLEHEDAQLRRLRTC